MHLENESKRRAKILCDVYEKLYDSRKDALKASGIQFSQMIRSSDNKPILVNLAACLSVPTFVQALEQGDGQLYAVLSLHWMRGDQELEWVFSHLCEAVYAYFNSKELKKELGDAAEYPFEDLRDYLREALNQYNHRFC